jgi:hypothetical protein
MLSPFTDCDEKSKIGLSEILATKDVFLVTDRRPTMASITYERETTALLVVDPYNDFISEGGKIWPHIKVVAEGNNCVPHMLEVLNAARKSKLRVFYAMHHRYRSGDYETWKYIAPIQKAAWQHKSFEYGTWGGEFRAEFVPKPGEIVATEPGQRLSGEHQANVPRASIAAHPKPTFDVLHFRSGLPGKLPKLRAHHEGSELHGPALPPSGRSSRRQMEISGS